MMKRFISKEKKEKLKRSSLYNVIINYRLFKKRFLELIYPITLKRAHINNHKPIGVSISKNPIINNQNVIVSLTTFPARITYVYKTIYSIMNQDMKPNGIYLWLSSSQFPNKLKDLPIELVELTKYGLSIEWVEEDLRSYKKLVYALKQFPDSFIITADDDLYYPSDWIEKLVQSYLEEPHAVHCHLTTSMNFNGKKIIFKDRYGNVGDGSINYMNKILGGSGTLYPPNSLYKDVTIDGLFMKLAPTNDDIWFWAMAVKNNYKIRWIPNGMKQLYYVEGSQDNTPCLVTINNHGENLRSIEFDEVLNAYDLYNKISE